MKSFFKDLPPLIRGIIILVILAVIIFIGWKIYQYFKKKKDQKGSRDAANASSDEYNKLSKNDSLSFPQATYEGTANTIQKLLDGCELPDSETQVISEIAKVVKKPIDWFYLNKVWGVRTIDNCGYFTDSTDYDLTTLLKDQLDSDVSANAIKIDGVRVGGLLGDFKSTNEFLSDYLKTIGINF